LRWFPKTKRGAVPLAFLMPFDETIETSLLPRLLHTLEKKTEQEHQRLILNFRAHVRLLSEYLRGEIIDGNLSLNTAVGFHTRLYPPGYMLNAADNDGNPVKISPGAWRQREIRDGVSPKRDEVCNPVPNVSAMPELSRYTYQHKTFRTRQHAPSGC